MPHKFESKQIDLDTPFLTKGITDTESDNTTVRETFKSLKNKMDFNQNLEKQLLKEGIFDLK